ncbi:TPA: hypothetical protein ACIVKW_003915 [Salmonella enterica subsp. enterica serovar Oslo]
MMKSDEQYQVPVWMRPLLPLLCNIQTRELVMLIKRLASSLKAVKPDSSVVREAQDWLCDRKLVDITDILR